MALIYTSRRVAQYKLERATKPKSREKGGVDNHGVAQVDDESALLKADMEFLEKEMVATVFGKKERESRERKRGSREMRKDGPETMSLSQMLEEAKAAAKLSCAFVFSNSRPFHVECGMCCVCALLCCPGRWSGPTCT